MVHTIIIIIERSVTSLDMYESVELFSDRHIETSGSWTDLAIVGDDYWKEKQDIETCTYEGNSNVLWNMEAGHLIMPTDCKCSRELQGDVIISSKYWINSILK